MAGCQRGNEIGDFSIRVRAEREHLFACAQPEIRPLKSGRNCAAQQRVARRSPAVAAGARGDHTVLNPAPLPDASGHDNLRPLAGFEVATDHDDVGTAVGEDLKLLNGIACIMVKSLVALDKMHERDHAGREQEIDLRAVIPTAIAGLVAAGKGVRWNLLAGAIGLAEIAAFGRKRGEVKEFDDSSGGCVQHASRV